MKKLILFPFLFIFTLTYSFSQEQAKILDYPVSYLSNKIHVFYFDTTNSNIESIICEKSRFPLIKIYFYEVYYKNGKLKCQGQLMKKNGCFFKYGLWKYYNLEASLLKSIYYPKYLHVPQSDWFIDEPEILYNKEKKSLY